MHYPRQPGAQPDILDIAVVKGVATQIEVSVLAELSSDHCPIEVHVPTRHTVSYTHLDVYKRQGI